MRENEVRESIRRENRHKERENRHRESRDRKSLKANVTVGQLQRGSNLRNNINAQERNKSVLKVIDGVSTSFYFIGFSDEWERSAMWRFFKSFGNVVDVYVPQKRAKNGKKFGFFRFIGIDNECMLVDKITAAWAGKDRLVMNKAKYERSAMNPSNSERLGAGSKNYFVVPGWQTTAPVHTLGKMSYAEAACKANLPHVQASGVRDEELT